MKTTIRLYKNVIKKFGDSEVLYTRDLAILGHFIKIH